MFIGGFYLICMATCAYCLRIVESHFDGRFMNILNCMWFTLLSMTTVGYGDLFVSTPIGIALDGFLMFSGVVIVSLLVSSLNGLFTLGYSKATDHINRIKTGTNFTQTAQGQDLAEITGISFHCPLPDPAMAIKENLPTHPSFIIIARILPYVQPTADDPEVREGKAT